ncbi:MAG: hypothetical protein V4472_25085 [Pseudomonadota bacterium]
MTCTCPPGRTRDQNCPTHGTVASDLARRGRRIAALIADVDLRYAERDAWIIEARQAGWSYTLIGQVLGVSRQRIAMILATVQPAE